jgi:hypothetical protein
MYAEHSASIKIEVSNHPISIYGTAWTIPRCKLNAYLSIPFYNALLAHSEGMS